MERKSKRTVSSELNEGGYRNKSRGQSAVWKASACFPKASKEIGEKSAGILLNAMDRGKKHGRERKRPTCPFLNRHRLDGSVGRVLI